jgi:ribonuclease BN (tRNA processing enzyme)
MAGLDPSVVNVYGLADVRRILHRNLLATDYWLDFFNPPDSGGPVFRFHVVDENTEFDVGTYRIRTIPSNHTVPTIGYQITDSIGRKLLYTSDNGPGSGENWKLAQPDLLITECTYSNAQRAVDSGRMHGHLCPSQLGVELEIFGRAQGYLPNVVVLHLNPLYEDDVRRELLEVARDLTASIEVSTEGATFAV